MGWILLLLIASFVFRLSIAALGYHVDIFSNAAWGEWIYRNGAATYYTNTLWIYSWPTQPPLINLLYGFNYFLYFDIFLRIFRHTSHVIENFQFLQNNLAWFITYVEWFGMKSYSDTPFTNGFLITMKYIPIVADLAIAVVLYMIAKLWNVQKALLYPFLYLFLPFSWYISALWGQYDQAGFLFTLLAFISLLNRRAMYSTPLLLAIGIAIKPTAILFIPIFIYIYFKQKPSMLHILIGLASTAALFIITTQPFTTKDIFTFTTQDLTRIIFGKSETRVTTNSFNFWRILIGNTALNDGSALMGIIPYKFFGYTAFVILNFLAIRQLKHMTMKSLSVALFIVGTGSFLFMTNMLERYIFAGIVFGLLAAMFYRNVLKYWLALSVIFLLNLYHGWWYPEQLTILKNALLWQDGLLTRLLSLVNVILFCVMTWSLLNQRHKKVQEENS